MSALSGDAWVLWLVVIAVAALVFLLALVVWVARQQRQGAEALSRQLAQVEARWSEQLQQRLMQGERHISDVVRDSAREDRQELGATLAQQQAGLLAQVAEGTRTQNAQIDALVQQITLLQKHVNDTLSTQLQAVSESTVRRLQEVRETLDAQLKQLQQGNAAKLDEMRQVVDEKLQATLHQRLGESFKQVTDHLEQVHRGLGEMHSLAKGVGDLKHLLTNVKSRGMFGEAQLHSLLEQVFTPEQYGVQVATRPGSRQVVDFAIRLPGRGEEQDVVWLPIDAKFPTEDYERLLAAQEQADPALVLAAQKALEVTVRTQAKSIAEKYLEPPYTTDFAVMFLPTESLYAEVLRVPGLMERLQREQRVSLAGPTTLLAMLNSLHMGFRTLALEKRSSEVWRVLGAVKTEFEKFGGVLSKVRSQTQTVLNTLDLADTRSRVMHKALSQVEALPDTQAQGLLPSDHEAT
jgi:DNA recombination protein RmuC